MQSISVSPSFTAHSSNNNLADIAARVVQEFRNENGEEDDIYDDDFTDDGNRFYIPSDNEKKLNENEANYSNSDSDEEFEFDVVRTTQFHNSSPVSADQIFSNGEIVPRYPLFDRSLLLDNDVVPNFYKIADNLHSNSNSVANFKASPAPVVQRVPLRKLFSEEQRDSASCSSSEADDLDGITPGTYCIWKPKAEESPGRCKKSNSTGNSSKRWKFRNFLHRSNSDNNFTTNKDASVVVFSPVTESKKKNRSDQKVKKVEKTSKVAVADGGDYDGDTTAPATVTIENNSANKTNKGGNNRLRSYLPYKQDLVGVFANVNGLSRNLHPF